MQKGERTTAMEGLLNLDVTYFVHKTCGLSWRVESKSFPIYGILLVLEGSAHYMVDGERFEATAGTMVSFRPGCSRLATTSTGMTCAAFDFTLRPQAFGPQAFGPQAFGPQAFGPQAFGPQAFGPQAFGAGSLNLPVRQKFAHTEELDRLLRDFQFEWLQKAEGYGLRCGAIFLLILHQLLYRGGEPLSNRHVEKMKRYIVEHYTEPTDVRELAELVGLSAVYCGALFRRTEGLTIAEYANHIRVRKAAALLEEQDYDITEIAYLCGFNDVYYFSGTFKRVMGASPSRYRALHTRSVADIVNQLYNDKKQ